MGNKRDPAAARRAILNAAARAFAALGPAGARIDAIAADAGVNKRMLYHYFGDKNALFAAVVNDRLGDRDEFPPAGAVLAGGLPIEVVDLRLMVWAAIAGVGPRLERTAAWQVLVRGLAAEQRAGRLRDDVEAGLLALALFAVSALPQLLPALAGDMDASWPQLRKLLLPAAGVGSARAGRPRVRMLPEVRGR